MLTFPRTRPEWTPRGELAVFIAAAGANCHDLPFLRLLLGGVGDDDAHFCLRFGLDTLDDDAVVRSAFALRLDLVGCMMATPRAIATDGPHLFNVSTSHGGARCL